MKTASLGDLKPVAKLTYLYLLAFDEVNFSRAELAVLLGWREQNYSAVSRTLGELERAGLLTFYDDARRRYQVLEGARPATFGGSRAPVNVGGPPLTRAVWVYLRGLPETWLTVEAVANTLFISHTKAYHALNDLAAQGLLRRDEPVSPEPGSLKHLFGVAPKKMKAAHT